MLFPIHPKNGGEGLDSCGADGLAGKGLGAICGKMFLIGLSLGMLGGALIVANSQKARQVVKDSQEDICNKAKSLKKQCKCGCEESEPSDKAKLKE